MKKATIVCLCLLISGAAFASSGQDWKDDEPFRAFWQKFKAAVTSGDKETVVELSSFPIRMPGRTRPIKNAADLRLRFKEVFNKRTNAAKCFARDDSQPVNQSEGGSPKGYAVFCDLGTGDLLIYDFKLTKAGWKFVRVVQETLPD